MPFLSVYSRENNYDGKDARSILLSRVKTVVARSHLLKLKCTKFDFGWGFAQTPLGELTTLPDLLAGFQGVLLLREGRGEEEGRTGQEGGKGRGGTKDIREGERKGDEALSVEIFGYATAAGAVSVSW